MNDQVYNKATYAARLNIMSDEAEHNMWLERAKEGLHYHDHDLYGLAVKMKDHYTEANPLSAYRMVYSDLLSWALACVDWREIAEEFIELAKEAENYAEETA